MRPLFGCAAVLGLRQTLLQLNAGHTALPKRIGQFTASSVVTAVLSLCQFPNTRVFPGQDYPAFAALFILSRSRNFIRALCNCDLLFPIEHPTMLAISLCS